MSDLNFQQLSTVQSNQSPAVPTVASATTVAPTTFATIFTGTAQLTNITPPVTGCHMLCFIFSDGAPGAFLTTGNIKTAYTPIQNRPVFLVYVPAENKYYVMSVT